MRKGPFEYKGYSIYIFYQKISQGPRGWGYRKFGGIAKIYKNGKWKVFNIDGNSIDEVEKKIKEKINKCSKSI